MGAAAEGVPERGLRLEQARGGPAADDRVAHLPGRERQRDLRRQLAGRGTGRIGRRLVEQCVLLVAHGLT